jgi:hypothetical protein
LVAFFEVDYAIALPWQKIILLFGETSDFSAIMKLRMLMATDLIQSINEIVIPAVIFPIDFVALSAVGF